MEHDKFQIAKRIEQRISFLNFTKKYMQSCFDGKPFGVSIQGAAMGLNVVCPLNTLNSKWDTNSLVAVDSEDTEFIINKIDERIKELETQFQKL